MTAQPIQTVDENTAVEAIKAEIRHVDLAQEFLNNIEALKGELTALNNLHGFISPSQMEGEYQNITSSIEALIQGTGGADPQPGLVSIMSQMQYSHNSSVEAIVDNPNGLFQVLITSIDDGDAGKNPLAAATTFNKMANALSAMSDEAGKNFVANLINQLDTIIGQG